MRRMGRSCGGRLMPWLTLFIFLKWLKEIFWWDEKINFGIFL